MSIENAYAAARGCWEQWTAGKRELPVATLYLKALSILGLHKAAHRFQQHVLNQFPTWNQVSEIAIPTTGPGGVIAWTSRRRRYEANLALALKRWPELAEVDKVWATSANDYELNQGVDGSYQIWKKTPEGGKEGGEWWIPLMAHRAAAEAWTFEKKGGQLVHPVAFDGPGLGYLLNRVLEQTHQSFINYSCAVYVVEENWAALAMWLHLQDLQRWLSEPRLRIFAGRGALNHLEKALADKPDWSIPRVVMSEAGSRPLIPQAMEKALQKRAQQEATWKETTTAYYTNKDTAYWHNRWAEALDAVAHKDRNGKELRVLGVTTRFSTVLRYSMEELAAAAHEWGAQVRVAMESDDQSLESGLWQALAEFKPDLVIQISRMRHENPELPRQVPFLCWDQDMLPCMRTPETKASLDSLTYVAGYGAQHGYLHDKWPRRNSLLCWPAGATHRFHNRLVDKELWQKHRCTFSYTSNASASEEQLLAEMQPAWTGPWGEAVQKAATEMLARSREGYAWDTGLVQRRLREILAERGLNAERRLMDEATLQLKRLTDRAFRHVALRWVKEYCQQHGTTLRLYGQGWEKNPEFAEYAAGFVAPGEELRAVYQASTISLQLIEMGFIHSRVLDGLAAGGFFLTRYAPEVRDFTNRARERMACAQRAEETGCVTYGQLNASKDPVIVAAWEEVRRVMRLGADDERCHWLDLWRHFPPEDLAFTGIEAITFDSRQSFFALAERYLGDAELRRQKAEELRQVVVEQFSYDARWREFVNGIYAGMKESNESLVSSH